MFTVHSRLAMAARLLVTTALVASCKGAESVAPPASAPVTPPVPPPPATPVARVEVTPNAALLVRGDTIRLSATPMGAAGAALSNRAIAWSSENQTVATVSTSGIVTGLTPGEATITATSEGRSGSSRVTVTRTPVGSIVIAPDTVALLVGDTTRLSATIKDTRGIVLLDRVATWTSLSSAVATITLNGLATALAPGRARIVATVEGRSDTADILVRPLPLVVSSSRSLANARVGDLTVRAGATLTAIGTRIEVDGDLMVEPGGAIVGTESRLELVVTGNLTLKGPLQSAGALTLVDDAAKIGAPPRSAVTGMVVDVIDGPPLASGVTLKQWRFHAPLEAGSLADPGTSAKVSAATSGGQNGATPRPIIINFTGNGVVSPSGNAPTLNLSIKNGGNGGNDSRCAGVGGKGGDGQAFELHVSGTLILAHVSFSGGSGGHGGDAVAPGPGAPGTINTGGAGGKPGTIRMTVERFGLVVGSLQLIDVHFRGWNGGGGGNAVLTGVSGGAPAGGASVTARGGAAASLEDRQVVIGPNVTGGPVIFAVLNGRDGGHATAAGGRGLPGVCDAVTGIASPSGGGGNATATGGAGAQLGQRGVVGMTGVDFTASFWPGKGGDGTALGGTGAHGVQCHAEGGRGGKGGNATASGGTGGVGGLGSKLVFKDGAALATAGSAGNGGLAGLNGGTAGGGGNASAASKDSAHAVAAGGGNGGDAVAVGGTGGNGGTGGTASSSFAATAGDGGLGGSAIAGGKGGDGGNGGDANSTDTMLSAPQAGNGGGGGCPGGAGGNGGTATGGKNPKSGVNGLSC